MYCLLVECINIRLMITCLRHFHYWNFQGYALQCFTFETEYSLRIFLEIAFNFTKGNLCYFKATRIFKFISSG